MIVFIFRGIPDPEPGEPEAEEKPLAPVDDDMFDERLDGFCKLGFDYLTALALAWNRASVSDCRERFIKHGATHAQAADYYLD